MAQSVVHKRGEAAPLGYQVTDENGVPLVLTGCTLFMGIKSNEFADTFVLTKDDEDFDKTQLASGIFTVFLSSVDLDMEPGIYPGGFTITFTDGVIDKGLEFDLVIEPART